MKNTRLFQMLLVFLLYSPVSVAQFENLVLDASETAELNGARIYGQVRVYANCTLKVDRGELGDPIGGRLEVVANRIDVLDQGKIDGTKTYGKNVYPPIADDRGGLGGSYGGHGGGPTLNERHETYGNSNLPVIQPGTKGGDGPDRVIYGGPPGGAITLRGETIIINGEINCDGIDGVDWQNNPYYPEPQKFFGGGGGSGGGILIVARHLTIGPNAKITANGGDGGDGWGVGGGYEGYPGGGGRIKIFYEDGTISETAIIEVQAGTAPESGNLGGVEDGTMHIQQVKSVDQLLNPGDVNGDGKTDHEDLFLMMQSWNVEVTPIPPPSDTPMPTP